VAQPPGSEFGADFFKYVLGPAGDTLSSFIQRSLPTPSGVTVMSPLPTAMPNVGIPGLTTPGGGTFGQQVPNGFVPAGPSLAPPVPMGGVVNPAQAAILTPPQPTKQIQDTKQPTTGTAYAPPRSGLTAVDANNYAPNVQRFASEISQAAQQTGVPERVLAAIVHIECANCDPSTVRRDSGAAGIAQVVGGPTDPLANLIAAGNLLREKQRIFGINPNDWDSTAAAYFGAFRPGVGITADRDSTGTTGISYVDKFRQAFNLYPDSLNSNTTTTPPTAASKAITSGAAPTVANARPTQFDPMLTKDEQLAACGPAVIAGLAGISVRDAVNVAKQFGWSTQTGMAGGGSESRALTAAGVANTYIPGVNVQQAREIISNGHPVIFSMGYASDSAPGHYFLADDYNPASGKWHVGQSGKDLRSGSDWMTLQEMARMGPPDSMIEVDK
jgi:hypothetical protein